MKYLLSAGYYTGDVSLTLTVTLRVSINICPWLSLGFTKRRLRQVYVEGRSGPLRDGEMGLEGKQSAQRG